MITGLSKGKNLEGLRPAYQPRYANTRTWGTPTAWRQRQRQLAFIASLTCRRKSLARDDNFVAALISHYLANLSSRPKRSVVERSVVLPSSHTGSKAHRFFKLLRPDFSRALIQNREFFQQPVKPCASIRGAPSVLLRFRLVYLSVGKGILDGSDFLSPTELALLRGAQP